MVLERRLVYQQNLEDGAEVDDFVDREKRDNWSAAGYRDTNEALGFLRDFSIANDVYGDIKDSALTSACMVLERRLVCLQNLEDGAEVDDFGDREKRDNWSAAGYRDSNEALGYL